MSTLVIIEEYKDRGGLMTHGVFKDNRIQKDGLGYYDAARLVLKIGKNGDSVQEYYESSGRSARTLEYSEFMKDCIEYGIIK